MAQRNSPTMTKLDRLWRNEDTSSGCESTLEAPCPSLLKSVPLRKPIFFPSTLPGSAVWISALLITHDDPTQFDSPMRRWRCRIAFNATVVKSSFPQTPRHTEHHVKHHVGIPIAMHSIGWVSTKELEFSSFFFLSFSYSASSSYLSLSSFSLFTTTLE